MIYRVTRITTAISWHDVLVRVPGGDSAEATRQAQEAAEDFLDLLNEAQFDQDVNDEALADPTRVAILDDNAPHYDDPDEVRVRWEIELAEDQTKEEL